MHNIRRGEISTPSVELKKLYLLTKMCSSVSRKSYVYLIIFPTIPSPSPWKWVSCSIPTISFFTLLLYIEWILQILSIMQQKIILYFFFRRWGYSTSAWFASDSHFIIKRKTADIHIWYAWENIVEDAINLERKMLVNI